MDTGRSKFTEEINNDEKQALTLKDVLVHGGPHFIQSEFFW